MTTSEPDFTDRRRRRNSTVRLIGGVVLVLVVIAAASSRDEALWSAAETSSSDTVEQESPIDDVVPAPQPTDESGSRLPDAGAELGVLAALLLIAVIVLAARTIPREITGWSWVPKARRRRRLPPTPLPEIPQAVEPDDAAVLAAIREGSPRNAIVRCWMLLEQDAAAAGMQRGPTETSSEYVERVIGASSVDPRPIADLGALFREARFSSRPVDETRREQAEQALTRTLASLGGRTEQRS